MLRASKVAAAQVRLQPQYAYQLLPFPNPCLLQPLPSHHTHSIPSICSLKLQVQANEEGWQFYRWFFPVLVTSQPLWSVPSYFEVRSNVKGILRLQPLFGEMCHHTAALRHCGYNRCFENCGYIRCSGRCVIIFDVYAWPKCLAFFVQS